MIHQLKCLEVHYQDVVNGRKKAELRKNDRDFSVGDILELSEVFINPMDSKRKHTISTGRVFMCVITHVLHGGEYGLEFDYVMLSIEPLNK